MYIHLYSLTMQVFYFRNVKGLSWDFIFFLFHLQNINPWIKSLMFHFRHFFMSSNFFLKNVLSKNYLNYWYIKIIGILNKEDLNLGNADLLHIASKDKRLESSDVKWWLFLTWNDLKIRVQGLVNKVFDTKKKKKAFKVQDTQRQDLRLKHCLRLYYVGLPKCNMLPINSSLVCCTSQVWESGLKPDGSNTGR